MGIQLFMKLFFLSLFPLFLLAGVPQAFSHLATAIDNERYVYLDLLRHEKFAVYLPEARTYFIAVEQAFKVGYKLDIEMKSEEGENEKDLRISYLKALRALARGRADLKNRYYQEVYLSMKEMDEDYFIFLINTAKTFLAENSKLKSQVLIYSKTLKQLQKNSVIKDLQAEIKLDEYSYVLMQKNTGRI